MPDKIIAARLELDTGSSSGKLSEFNKEVSGVKTNLKDTGAAALKTGKDVDVSTGSFGKLKGQIGDLPGPLGAAGQGVTKLSGTFKALLANPIVLLIAAIVAGLALLYKSFTNTFAGGQKMEQIFAGIKAAGQALIDNLTKVASAIVKVFKFDFSGAIDDIKGVAKAAGDAFNAMADLTKEAQQLHKEQLDNDLDQAKRAKDLAILREQATDESVPLAKRKAALKELQAAAQDNAKKDIDLAKRTTDNFIAQNTLQKDGALKNQDEINAAKIKQIQVETDNANELRRINKQVSGAEKQEAAERNEAAKAATEAAKQNRQRNFEANNAIRKLEQENILLGIKDAHEKELKALEFKIAEEKRINDQAIKDRKVSAEQGRQIEAALTTQFILQQQALIAKHKEDVDKAEADKKEKDAAEKLKKDEDDAAKTKEILDGFKAAEKEHTKMVEDEKDKRVKTAEAERDGRIIALQGYAAALDQVSAIVGQNTIAGKALAVAASLVNTYTAITGQLAAFSKVPIPGYAIAQAIVTGLVGLANVKKIISVNVPGGGGSGGINPTLPTALAPAAPIAPTQTSTNIANTDAINNANRPIRAYVVAEDNAAAVNREARLHGASVLGGG